jgi:gliding motility-associated lipoprotein GldD
MFQMPDYFVAQRKTKFFDEDVSDDCWLNLECSDLNATIYLSYKTLSPDKNLQRLSEEAYALTFKHTQKADYIQPQEIDNQNGGVGLIYYVGGDAASNIQFFITDTTEHFMRGALYFYAHPNADSLRPVVQFMVDDIKGILASWRWKE